MTPEALGYSTRRTESPSSEMRKAGQGAASGTRAGLHPPLDLSTWRALVTLTGEECFW